MLLRQRLRLALPDDTRATDEDVKILTPAGALEKEEGLSVDQGQRSALRAPSEILELLFKLLLELLLELLEVPKPFNPEKEFQKRQLRIREKVAAMQKSKLGYVDPQLAAKIPVEPRQPSHERLGCGFALTRLAQDSYAKLHLEDL